MTLQNSEWKSMFGSNESDSSNASLSPKARTLQKTAESLEKKLNTSQTMSQTSSSSGSFVTMSQSQVSSEGSIRSVTEKGSEKNPISELTFVCHLQMFMHTCILYHEWGLDVVELYDSLFATTLFLYDPVIFWLPTTHKPPKKFIYRIKRTKSLTNTVLLFLAKYHNCKIALRNIVHKKRELYSAESKDLLEIAWERRPPPSNWKPKGLLVAHLQEHRAAINR